MDGMADLWDWLMGQLLHDRANEDIFKIFLFLTILAVVMLSAKGFGSGGDGGGDGGGGC